MTETSKRILIVDDDTAIVSGLEALLSDQWEVRPAYTGRDARAAFVDFSPDVVLLDMNLPDASGIDLLHDFKMYSESVAVIMMSGGGTFDRVVESMKLGAETFLPKPFDYDTLTLTLETVSRMIATRRELVALKRGEGADAERLPGTSAAVEQLNQLLAQIARAPSPVMIEGESGSGKGIFARLIHNARRGPARRSSISTAPGCRRSCWSRSSSATSAARSPTPWPPSRGSSRSPPTGRCSSTRSRRWRSPSRPVCSRRWKRSASAASAGSAT
jgi:DNA-binding NtrC family response regulator